MPGLEIFAQGLVERQDGGWRITDAGRSALDLMESKAAVPSPVRGSMPATNTSQKPSIVLFTKYLSRTMR
jgi:hypothetical protein